MSEFPFRRLVAALYRVGMSLAPASAYSGFEGEIVDAFLQKCSSTYTRRGPWALFRDLIVGFADLARQNGREWVDRVTRGGAKKPSGSPADPEGSSFLASIIRDLKQGLRAATGNLGYSASVIGTLGVVVGMNTAVFTVLDNVLFDPLAFPDEDRLVMVYRHYPDYDWVRGPMSFPDYRDWQGADTGLESLAAITTEDYTFIADGVAERWSGLEVTTNFPSVARVEPVLGRWFAQTDNLLESERVVILAHGTWVRTFGADVEVVGRTISLNDSPYQVVGVMGPDFSMPNKEADFIAPLPNHD